MTAANTTDHADDLFAILTEYDRAFAALVQSLHQANPDLPEIEVETIRIMAREAEYEAGWDDEDARESGTALFEKLVHGQPEQIVELARHLVAKAKVYGEATARRERRRWR